MDEFISPPAPVQAAAASRAAPATWARIGLLGISAAAFLAVALLAFGSGASPAGTLAAGSTGTNDNAVVESLNGFGGGPGFGGGRGGFGHGFGGITISAISGSSISLETADGWTRTITVDSGTTYTKSGDTIALGDLAIGDQVGFRQTLESDGSWTIDSIAVIPPHEGGEVTAVSDSTITVTQRDGTAATINVDASTTYEINRATGALADVKVGMFLVAEGTRNSDGSLDASSVRAADRGVGGKGFRGGFGPGDHVRNPDASAAPSATGSAT